MGAVVHGGGGALRKNNALLLVNLVYLARVWPRSGDLPVFRSAYCSFGVVAVEACTGYSEAVLDEIPVWVCLAGGISVAAG